MFRRPHHKAVRSALNALDGDLFLAAECYFAGGTAIVMSLNEYRESVDIEFLCASQSGYRTLRQTIWNNGFEGLIKPGAPLKALRDVQSDQYGVRTFIESRGMRIKFEIVREARVELSGAMDDRFGVPMLARTDLYTEKLLANADRWADRATRSRDVIDLTMMISRWGDIPEASWTKARDAYGETVDRAYENAVALIRNAEWLGTCMQAMQMDPQLSGEIFSVHGGPQPRADAAD